MGFGRKNFQEKAIGVCGMGREDEEAKQGLNTKQSCFDLQSIPWGKGVFKDSVGHT